MSMTGLIRTNRSLKNNGCQMATWVSMAGTENAIQHHCKHALKFLAPFRSVREHARHKNNGEEYEKDGKKQGVFIVYASFCPLKFHLPAGNS